MTDSAPQPAGPPAKNSSADGVLQRIGSRIGPGILFAGAAIGASHMIQATRAGGDYGVSMWSVILVATVLKYPAFLFGAKYASVTGRSLMHRYVDQGWGALLVFGVELVMLMFIVTGVLAVMTGGLLNEFTGLGFNDFVSGCLVLAASAALVLGGHYHLLERVSKILVGCLSFVIILAAIIAVPNLIGAAEPLALWPALDGASVPFIIALAGWMPTGISASVLLSLWVCAKSRDIGRPVTPTEAGFDFRLGYVLALLVGIAFMLLGAALLHGRDVAVASSATEFAGQLVGLFVASFGAWAYPFFAFATFAVMWSSLLAILDACPRAIGTIVRLRAQYEGQDSVDTSRLFRILVVVQCVGAIIVLATVMRSFRSFVDFAMSVTWITAPLLAWLNHRAVFSSDVDPRLRPGRGLWLWSVIGIVSMVGFAFLYFYLTFLR